MHPLLLLLPQLLQAVTIDVDDLEEDATPEDIMLSYVSGEKSKVWGRCWEGRVVNVVCGAC